MKIDSPHHLENHEPVRLLIVDRHVLTKNCLAIAFQKVPLVAEVATASKPSEASEIARMFQPSVALVDLALPLNSGFEIAQKLVEFKKSCRVILLDDQFRCPLLQTTIQIGASGYWARSSPFDPLAQAVIDASQGKYAFCPEAIPYLTFTSKGPVYTPDQQILEFEPLTSREMEMLKHVADGRSTKEAATMMEITPKTAENHKYSIMRKFDVNNTAQMLRIAVREGLMRW